MFFFDKCLVLGNFLIKENYNNVGLFYITCNKMKENKFLTQGKKMHVLYGPKLGVLF